MGLIKARLGNYIEQVTQTNADCALSKDAVVGMTITKELIPTKAKLEDADISKYIIVPPNTFVYNPRTHGKHIGFGFNDTMRSALISWNNAAFRISPAKRGELDARYLFLHFSRDEWDREACFCSWGSSTEVFSWNALCDMQIYLPPIEVQRKYVAIYEAMLGNQRAYEQGLDDLKLTCDALVEKLMREARHEAIGPYIEQSDARNNARIYGEKDVRGLSVSKCIIETNTNLTGVNLSNYKIICPDELAYVADTSRRGEKISIAHNETDETYITSAINTVFHVKKSAEQKLLPSYLMLFFGRSEFDRYARFNSWGSARETFDWAEMCDVRIPLPDITVQRYAVELYQAWRTRLAINDRLKAQLKNICPILIRGSIEEASK